MSRSKRADRVESALRRADAALEAWFRRSARVLRQRVDGLQGGLKQLRSGLERFENDRKPATSKRRDHSSATGRAARPRKPKKAA